MRLPLPVLGALARRFFAPLPCAVLLAAAIAVVGPHRGAPPADAVPDDRQAERIVGAVHAPVVRTPLGFGARVGDVWVWSTRELLPGQRVAATGRLRTPRGFRDPGVPDRAELIASRGAQWELSATSIEVLEDEPGLADRAWRWAGEVQQAWARDIDGAGDRGGAAALRGIVTGDRGDVPDALDRRWRAVGIFHVLSVSGLHLAVVAGLLFALLRRLVAASPWGGRLRPARWAAPPALAMAIAYTMITGAQLATVRALVVVAIVLVAQMLDRPVRLVDALGLAAIAILVWRPGDLRDPSFQLSFVAALVLALRGGARGSWIVRAVTTSLWIAIATAPITAYHFQQVQAGGVVGNLVLTPAIELVALPLALAGIVLPGGKPLVAIAVWIVARVDDLAGLLARVVPVGHIGVASAAMMGALVAVSLVVATPAVARVRFARSAAWLALVALWALARTPPPAGELRVTFLDVGQGTATLVELPDGAVWLVDAGGNASARDLASAAAPGRAITATLATYDHGAIDLAIVSHPHPDHYLGLAAIDAPIRELWSADDTQLPPPAGPKPTFSDVAAALAARGTRLVHPPLGVARAEAGVELIVLAPRWVARDGAAAIEAADPVRSVNDNSLVVVIRYAGRTILLPGDIEREGEDNLVAGGLGHADVVAVPHHGSPTSSSEPFVAASRPSLAVISCGVANHFGFPSAEVVARWRGAGAAVARTDLGGAITVGIAPDGALSFRSAVP